MRLPLAALLSYPAVDWSQGRLIRRPVRSDMTDPELPQTRSAGAFPGYSRPLSGIPCLDPLSLRVQAALADGPPGRAFAIDWQDGRAWLKLGSPKRYLSWHRAQGALAALLRWPVIRPTVARNGVAGIAYEAGRLVALRRLGAPVPEVLGFAVEGPQGPWLVVSDMGASVESVLEGTADLDGRRELLVQCAEALARLHSMGEWHGSGQLRDLVLTAGKEIGFIDFEEDLSAVMPAAQAQARDLLMFLMSAARFADQAGHPLPEVLAAYRDLAPPSPWPELRRIGRVLAPAAWLIRPFAARLGRDARHALIAARALLTRGWA